jgi:hypothetical protein
MAENWLALSRRIASGLASAAALSSSAERLIASRFSRIDERDCTKSQVHELPNLEFDAKNGQLLSEKVDTGL